jgi:hypothetical protein
MLEVGARTGGVFTGRSTTRQAERIFFSWQWLPTSSENNLFCVKTEEREKTWQL